MTTREAVTTQDALAEYLIEQNVIDPDVGREDPYIGNWFYFTIGGKRIPFFPSVGFKAGLAAHDTHHMLNDYSTSWVGECETAAWELASGGCGRHFAYWIDRLFFMGIALVLAPIRSLRAWRRGWGQRNLYRLDHEQLLAMDIGDVRRYISA